VTRIIAGFLKGRQIHIPVNLPVRPTTDRAREALFSSLDALGGFTGKRVLDLCAGTGTLGFEALSRDALHVVFVDQHPLVVKHLHLHAQQWKVEDRVTMVRKAAMPFANYYQETPFDIILADPPYDMPELDQWPDLLLSEKLLVSQGILVLEHAKPWSKSFENHPYCFKQKAFGTVHFSFFQVAI
jgi:16S rRNA (guanine966-N2)-methyltransferase